MGTDGNSGQMPEAMEWGEGDRICVMMHASATGPKSLTGMARAMEGSGLHLVAPAAEGYGASDSAAPGANPGLIARNAERICAVSRAHAARNPILFGHSIGGLYAVHAALKLETEGVRLAGLVLYDPILHDVLDQTVSAEKEALDWDQEIIAAMGADISLGQPAQGVARFVKAWNETEWSDLPEPARVHLAGMADHVFAGADGLPGCGPDPAGLSQLSCPTLVIWGENSPPFVDFVARRASEVIPNGRGQMLTDAGHMAPLLQAGRVADALTQFAAGLDVAEPA